jgi:hypothetical protein
LQSDGDDVAFGGPRRGDQDGANSSTGRSRVLNILITLIIAPLGETLNIVRNMRCATIVPVGRNSICNTRGSPYKSFIKMI